MVNLAEFALVDVLRLEGSGEFLDGRLGVLGGERMLDVVLVRPEAVVEVDADTAYGPAADNTRLASSASVPTWNSRICLPSRAECPRRSTDQAGSSAKVSATQSAM